MRRAVHFIVTKQLLFRASFFVQSPWWQISVILHRETFDLASLPCQGACTAIGVLVASPGLLSSTSGPSPHLLVSKSKWVHGRAGCIWARLPTRNERKYNVACLSFTVLSHIQSPPQSSVVLFLIGILVLSLSLSHSTPSTLPYLLNPPPSQFSALRALNSLSPLVTL